MILDGVGRASAPARPTELLELRRPRRAGRPPARSGCPAASSSASRSPWRWPTGRRCCSPTSRPASSTRATAHEVFDLLRQRQPRARRDDRRRDPRPAGQRAGQPDDRDPRRPDEQRDAPPDGAVTARATPRHRRGVRRPRPRRPAAAAAGVRRGARAGAARPARARAGPHQRLAGPADGASRRRPRRRTSSGDGTRPR